MNASNPNIRDTASPADFLTAPGAHPEGQSPVVPPEPRPVEPTPVDPTDPTDPGQPNKPIQPTDPYEPTHPQARQTAEDINAAPPILDTILESPTRSARPMPNSK